MSSGNSPTYQAYLGGDDVLGNLLVINQDKRPFLKSLHAPTRSASGAPHGGFLKKIVLDFSIVDAAATRGYHLETRGG